MKLTAILPMRHESERVPGKNFRSFGGKPLYHRMTEALLACPEIGTVVIDTDSPTIMEDAAREFPDIMLLERPEHLRAGTVPMNDVLLHDVKRVAADYYLQTHSTNPLLRPATISRGIQTFLDALPRYDSLFSVTRMQARIWDHDARPVNHDPAVLERTQDLPPLYAENSCLYMFTRESIEGRKSRIGERPLMFEIDREEALDIDEELDFRMAEILYLEGAKR